MSVAAGRGQLAPMTDTDSNPFCTRFTRPGAIVFRFVNRSDDRGGQTALDSPNDDPAEKGDPIGKLVATLHVRRVGQIIGPHGTGKSTLIEALMPALSSRFGRVARVQLHASESASWFGYRHRRKIGRRIRRLVDESGKAPLLIVDGAEQVSWIDRIRLRRHAFRNKKWLLVTSHRPLRGFAALYTTTVSRSLVESLSQKLLVSSADHTAAFVADALSKIEIDEGTNVRELWFDLYDAVQTRNEKLASRRDRMS